MGFLKDLVRSLYDLKGIGRELSTRRPGRVVATLFVVAALLGLTRAVWYSGMVGDLTGILVQEATVHMPPFTISEGKLSSSVEQPYIVTDHDLSPELFSALDAWSMRWLHTGSEGQTESFFEMASTAGVDSLCLVLDTTGTYQEQINPEACLIWMVVDEDSLKFGGSDQRRSRREREIRFAELQIEEPFIVDAPDLDAQATQGAVRGFALLWLSIFGIVGTPLHFAIKALLVGLLGWLISAVTKKGLTFGRTYAIAVYALTPVAVLSLIPILFVQIPGIVLVAVHLAYGWVPVFLCPKKVETPGAPEVPA